MSADCQAPPAGTRRSSTGSVSPERPCPETAVIPEGDALCRQEQHHERDQQTAKIFRLIDAAPNGASGGLSARTAPKPRTDTACVMLASWTTGLLLPLVAEMARCPIPPGRVSSRRGPQAGPWMPRPRRAPERRRRRAEA
jgi:hypothetical protein